VQLVGMQEVELAGEADPAGPAIAELLNARRRDPERVCVVAVKREGAAAEAGLDPLDAGRAGAGADHVARARSF